MKRRNFLIGGIAASAAVRAWPFRVYSFPSQVIIVDYWAEKEKYLRLARAYIDHEVTKFGMLEPSPDGEGYFMPHDSEKVPCWT
jgi:hypothetical protein